MVEQTRMSVILIVQDLLYVVLMTNIHYSLLVITPTENRNTICNGRTDKNVCFTNRVRFVVCWSYDQHILLSVGDPAKRDQQRTETLCVMVEQTRMSVILIVQDLLMLVL